MCESEAALRSAIHTLLTVNDGPSFRKGISKGAFSGSVPVRRNTSTELSAISGGFSRNRRIAKNTRKTERKTSRTPVTTPIRNLAIATSTVSCAGQVTAKVKPLDRSLTR
jgi:hypothetical protein